MATDRKFAGFGSSGSPSFRMTGIPPAGFCLSSFLLITDRSGRVLMGKLDPEYSWDHIGALDDERKRRFSSRWMLPSSHLLYGESPSEAARRILREQLGLETIELSGPVDFSEQYVANENICGMHWDLEFIFRGRYDGTVSHPAWKELAFVDPNAPKDEFARNHQDILRLAGMRN